MLHRTSLCLHFCTQIMIFFKEKFLDEEFMAPRYLCFKVFFCFVIHCDKLPSEKHTLYSPIRDKYAYYYQSQ